MRVHRRLGEEYRRNATVSNKDPPSPSSRDLAPGKEFSYGVVQACVYGIVLPRLDVQV